MIGFWVFMLCMDLLIPLFMVGFGAIFLKHPPREINGIYGYRTSRSMASQETWDYAHAYFGKLWFIIGIIMLILCIPAMLPCLGKDDGAVGLWGGILSGAECVFMILPIIPTEIALKRRFG